MFQSGADFERLDREAVLRLGVEADAAVAKRRQRRFLQLLHRAPPLERDPRLDPRLAAVAEGDRVPVRLALLELVVLLQPREHTVVRLRLGQSGEVAGLLVHRPVRPDHGQLGEIVVAADLVVHRIVTRRHLQGTGPEVPLDPLVGDHRHDPPDVGNDDVAADEVAVAVVLGVHRDGDVREHRRRPDSGDRDVAVAVGQRIADEGQRIVDVLVRDLEVGERGQVERAPVDDPVRPVQPAPVPEVDEEAHHRTDVRLVHREPLAAVVERGADPPELEHDLAAVLAEPLPDALLERLPPEVLAGLPLGRELLLDGVLGRDPSVVEARLEEDVEALHPPRADDRVRERELERVAEMQVAGDVRRRVRDREALPARIRVRVVEPLVLPRALPALLDPCRRVERVHGLILRSASSRSRRLLGSEIVQYWIRNTRLIALCGDSCQRMDPRCCPCVSEERN